MNFTITLWFFLSSASTSMMVLVALHKFGYLYFFIQMMISRNLQGISPHKRLVSQNYLGLVNGSQIISS